MTLEEFIAAPQGTQKIDLGDGNSISITVRYVETSSNYFGYVFDTSIAVGSKVVDRTGMTLEEMIDYLSKIKDFIK